MHVLGMPPAFVLSQDQTLRLTLDLHPHQPRPVGSGHPKSGSRHFNALSSRRSPTPQNPQIPPETRKSHSSPLPETHKQQVHEPATASPRPPPAHPFSITTMSNNNAAREPELHFLPCAAGRPYTSVQDPCQTNYAGMMTARPAIRRNRINSLIQRKLLD